jgi:hypothetical protein
MSAHRTPTFSLVDERHPRRLSSLPEATPAPDLFPFLKFGSQRFADRLVLPVVGASFFVCGAIVVRDVPLALAIALGAALVAVAPGAWSWRWPEVSSVPPELATRGPWRVNSGVSRVWGLTGVGLGLAAYAVLLLTTYHGGHPDRAPKLAPLFVPAVLYVTHAHRRIEESGARLSRLSWGLLIYAMGAAFVCTASLDFSSPDWPRVQPFATPLATLWALTPALLLYYALRSAHLVQKQAESLFVINRQLAKMDDPRTEWQNIATMLQQRLSCQRLIIVEPDERYYTRAETDGGAVAAKGSMLCVVGAAGEGVTGMMTFSYPMDSGVSYRAFLDQRMQVVRDTRFEPAYVGFDATTRSEVIVPVFDIDRPDLLLAIIVLQSSRVSAFSELDGERVQQFARHLEFYYRSSRTPLTFYRRLRHEMARMQRVTVYEELISSTIHAVRRLFSTERVGFIELGIGTGVPLDVETSGGAQKARINSIPRTFSHPYLPLTPDAVSNEMNPLTRAIETWEPVFFDLKTVQSHASSSTPRAAATPLAWKQWASDEGLVEVAIVPIGTNEQQIGLLLVGFCRASEAGFRSSLLLFLTSVAGSMGPSLAAASYLQQIYEAFLRPRIHLHRYLGEVDLSRGEIERKLRELGEQNENPQLRDVLSQFQTAIDRVYAAEAVTLPMFAAGTTRDAKTLESALDEFKSGLQKFKGGRRSTGDNTKLVFRIDPEIQAESASLKTILFRLITEGVINAVTHGRAQEVAVRVTRLRRAVTVTIRDTGVGFDPSTLDRRPSHPGDGGIVALGRELRKLCGADPINWHWTAKGKGTVLKISIPLHLCSSAPEAAIVNDRLDAMETP